jgi:hypothetical protein
MSTIQLLGHWTISWGYVSNFGCSLVFTMNEFLATKLSDKVKLFYKYDPKWV